MNGSETFAALITNLNNLIDRQNAVQAARVGRSAVKNNNPEDGERPGEL